MYGFLHTSVVVGTDAALIISVILLRASRARLVLDLPLIGCGDSPRADSLTDSNISAQSRDCKFLRGSLPNLRCGPNPCGHQVALP
jgi:hypothetical protein